MLFLCLQVLSAEIIWPKRLSCGCGSQRTDVGVGGGGGLLGWAVERLYAAGLIGAFKYMTDGQYIILSFSNLVTFNLYFIFT